MVGPALIGAGASLLGGVLADKAAGDRNDKTLANAALDREYQKEFAQQGIKWRVADAQSSGVHPLYALGANLPTYSPSPINLSSRGNFGRGLADAGQQLSRAYQATRSEKERKAGRAYQLSIERAELENDLLRAQIAREMQNRNPPLPGPASPLNETSSVDVTAERVPTVMADQPSSGAGIQPTTRWVQTREGLQAVPHPESYEDADVTSPSALFWFNENYVKPGLGLESGKKARPPDRLLPKNAVGWEFYPTSASWKPAYKYPTGRISGMHFVPRGERTHWTAKPRRRPVRVKTKRGVLLRGRDY